LVVFKQAVGDLIDWAAGGDAVASHISVRLLRCLCNSNTICVRSSLLLVGIAITQACLDMLGLMQILG